MAQGLTQTQEQTQEQIQQQRLTAQQVMFVRMLEMPLAQLEQKVQNEINENPALVGEKGDADTAEPTYETNAGPEDMGTEPSFEEEGEPKDREDELEKVLEGIDKDDRLEGSNYERMRNHDPNADQEQRVYGDMESFYDKMQEQMREQLLTDRQEVIMKYLIGSLDSDGLLRKELSSISDEIAIKEYIDVSEDEIEHCLNILQSFDPAGIGAQSLQQCLLIQIFRKKPSYITKLMHRVIDECYDDFIKNHRDKIAERLGMNDDTAQEVFKAIKKLNPRPGAALGETIGRSIQQVTPDFIIDIDEDENITFRLNQGEIPELYVAKDFTDMMEGYRQNPKSMNRKDKEALLYTQQNVERAKSYIDAIKQRRITMTATMRSIIALQRPYLLSGDDEDLKPMILKDVAQRAGVDISTVSRVCNSKYAQTPWGIISLKSFFSDGYDTGQGETVSTRTIKRVLREIIEQEDKRKPLSDIKLAEKMKQKGYPIARRTVAKYREQLGIPQSNMRK